MALQINKDSYETREVTLSGLVAMCTDCEKMCWQKTERVVENSSRAPRGWETLFREVADDRRKEEFTRCVEACTLLPRSCPDLETLKRYEALSPRQLKQKTLPPGTPSIQQMARCEHAAERFSTMLFTLAQKPTKVSFDARDPKTGELQETKDDEGASDVHRKVLLGAQIASQAQNQASAAEESDTRGTVPRW